MSQPYATTSRGALVQDLGAAGQTKRPTSVVLIKEDKENAELMASVKALPKPF